jgi:hypothetical protein
MKLVYVEINHSVGLSYGLHSVGFHHLSYGLHRFHHLSYGLHHHFVDLHNHSVPLVSISTQLVSIITPLVSINLAVSSAPAAVFPVHYGSPKLCRFPFLVSRCPASVFLTPASCDNNASLAGH